MKFQTSKRKKKTWKKKKKNVQNRVIPKWAMMVKKDVDFNTFL